ncbi:MAG: hypothetical protein LUG15_08030 [Oscillospiraceae bacterium]|nr:hypothetical protein [Oscillospiraceae bacterium]
MKTEKQEQGTFYIMQDEDESITNVIIDGVNLSKYATKFEIAQEAHEIPKLVLEIPLVRGFYMALKGGAKTEAQQQDCDVDAGYSCECESQAEE